MKKIILLSLLALIVYGADAEDKWSGRWTLFPADSTLCKSEFGPEFEVLRSESCGVLSAGKKALCRKDFPGCKSTACYSALISDTCTQEFGNDFPIKKGGFIDCAPGFYRSRCCPQ